MTAVLSKDKGRFDRNMKSHIVLTIIIHFFHCIPKVSAFHWSCAWPLNRWLHSNWIDHMYEYMSWVWFVVSMRSSQMWKKINWCSSISSLHLPENPDNKTPACSLFFSSNSCLCRHCCSDLLFCLCSQRSARRQQLIQWILSARCSHCRCSNTGRGNTWF